MIRRALFQAHLWTGVALALYLSLIGVTGSILVFGLEIQPAPSIVLPGLLADITAVVGHIRAAYPHVHVVSVIAPTETEPFFTVTLQRPRRITVACSPTSGEVLHELHRQAIWLDTVYDLHENLLVRRTGRVLNGIGAAFLLVMAVTGLVIWWPRRIVTVDFRRRWRRLNFDLHNVAGFWTFLFLAMWAVSGVYFAWPDRVLAAVDRFSPVLNSRPPAVSVSPDSEMAPLDFSAMLQQAHTLDPSAQWKGIIFPGSRSSPFEILMSRAKGIGRDYEDTLYFNPYNGQYISTWQYGVNKSLGDWFIWLQMPLHFGTHWGLGVKIIWALVGLSLPLQAATGLLMYWNRFLSKQWKR